MNTRIQKDRIIENIFDIICNTQFKMQAEDQMRKDLLNKNIDLSGDTITIQIVRGVQLINQYKITITKA